MSKWYRRRIIERETVSGTILANDPEVLVIVKRLRERVEARIATYFRGHEQCQVMRHSFYKVVSGPTSGLAVLEGATLFGPPDMEKEILLELIDGGKIR